MGVARSVKAFVSSVILCGVISGLFLLQGALVRSDYTSVPFIADANPPNYTPNGILEIPYDGNDPGNGFIELGWSGDTYNLVATNVVHDPIYGVRGTWKWMKSTIECPPMSVEWIEVRVINYVDYPEDPDQVIGILCIKYCGQPVQICNIYESL